MSFSSNTHYHIRPETGACLAALTGRDGSTPFPIRTKSCQVSNDDTILWQFNPDGQGRYFIYNKAWPGKSNRLDLVLQDKTSLYIPWMGPSDDIYNNQRWSVTTSGNSFQISSFGLPGALLTVTEIQGQSSLGALLRNDTEVDNSVATWQVVDVSEESSAPSPEPSPKKPAVESTLAPVDPIPTPKPKPSTFVTSTLPNTEQTIPEADQTISSQLSQPSSFSTLATGTGIDQSSSDQATNTRNSSHPTSSSEPSSSSSAGLNHTSLILVIVIPVVVAILALLALGWFFWRKQKNRQEDVVQDVVQPALRDHRPESNTFYGDLMEKFNLRYKAPATATNNAMPPVTEELASSESDSAPKGRPVSRV
ncbi:hypothetical protein QBC37DRAFT_29288 [Rhypophila decipiens]|uniref:Ricin B lectin domain-containing protein n=1 Tax=Rhypophila decipiens TaxID=261697 RepID=A0AAN7B5D2_9PEZI|nr:hypothetical protein QBC37DRAFT_29288 [Rhypophila decipiens]